MAYQPVVPGQEAAKLYLERVAALGNQKLRLTGHSKGGNLAVYSAACGTPDVQEKIESIWNFDGPGMHPDVFASEGYAAVRERIHSYLPQTSIIGLLMEYARPYTVVRSTASGISQHDPMTWQVYGPRFEVLPSVDQTAVLIRDTLHEWLQNSTPEQRAAFVEALFSMVETTGATRMSELTGEKLKSMLTMVGNRKEVDPEMRRVFTRLMAQAVTLGFGNVIDRVRGRRDENSVGGNWETMTPEKRKEMLTAAMNGKSEPEPAPGPAPAEGQKEHEEPQNDP